jgi:hypothetical protein
MYSLFVFYVFLCVNVYFCHRVSTQLQLNISYHMINFYTKNVTSFDKDQVKT